MLFFSQGLVKRCNTIQNSNNEDMLFFSASCLTNTRAVGKSENPEVAVVMWGA